MPDNKPDVITLKRLHAGSAKSMPVPYRPTAFQPTAEYRAQMTPQQVVSSTGEFDIYPEQWLHGHPKTAEAQEQYEAALDIFLAKYDSAEDQSDSDEIQQNAGQSTDDQGDSKSISANSSDSTDIKGDSADQNENQTAAPKPWQT